jgi:hypothetical protein
MISNKVWKNGSVIAVWLKGDNKQELLENYWSYWNHGATSADDLHWANELQGYFWTSERQLKRYFKNSSRAIVLNELGEDWQGETGRTHTIAAWFLFMKWERLTRAEPKEVGKTS